MIFKHTCLDDGVRPGQEADCETCRALLLEAFRGPDRPVDRTGAHPGWLGRSGIEPLHDTETEFNPASPFDRGSLVPPETPVHVHVTHIRAEGSFWEAYCSCGWTRGGAPLLKEASGWAVDHCQNLQPPAHVTMSDVRNGLWTVTCSCGWYLGGRYPAGQRTETEREARDVADKHRREAP